MLRAAGGGFHTSARYGSLFRVHCLGLVGRESPGHARETQRDTAMRRRVSRAGIGPEWLEIAQLFVQDTQEKAESER